MDPLAEISLSEIISADAGRKKAIADEIDAALKTLGFFVVSDHGEAR